MSAPRITGVSSKSGHAAGGDTVTLTGSGFHAVKYVGCEAIDAARYTYLEQPAPQVTSVLPATGGIAGGTRVTMRGSNLTGALAVTFDKRRSTALTVVSPTELTVMAPAHPAMAS